MRGARIVLLLALILCQAVLAAGPAFDVERATKAYLDRVPPAEKARSDAYFEGGYWLVLWDYLAGAAVSLLLLEARWSARMRDVAARVSSRTPVHTFVYWLEYLVTTSVLLFPLTIYAGYYREHRYGLSNQTLAAWLGDETKGFLLGAVFGGLAVVCLFAVVRRLERTWWIWGAVLSVIFLTAVMMVYPVFVAPMFNRYTKLTDERVRGPILSLARANGIEAHEVYQVDASRQSKRISANVSGLFGTERISLNDNLLNRCTLPEIEAVMAHEMGHYVLHHVFGLLVFSGAVTLASFAFLKWSAGCLLLRRGERWQVRSIADPAVIPLAVLLVSTVSLVLTPVTNCYVRMHESEADIFGLNAARQPDGFAETALKLGEYRKLNPSPLEETIFYDHPSGRTRIYTAMRWKAENLHQTAAAAPGLAAPPQIR